MDNVKLIALHDALDSAITRRMELTLLLKAIDNMAAEIEDDEDGSLITEFRSRLDGDLDLVLSMGIDDLRWNLPCVNDIDPSKINRDPAC